MRDVRIRKSTVAKILFRILQFLILYPVTVVGGICFSLARFGANMTEGDIVPATAASYARLTWFIQVIPYDL